MAECTHGRGAGCHHCTLSRFGGYFAIPEEIRIDYMADEMQEDIEKYDSAQKILGDDFDLDIDFMGDEMSDAGYTWEYLRDGDGSWYASWVCGDSGLCGQGYTFGHVV